MTMSKITVIAKVVARKDSIEAAKAELIKMIAPTRKEGGCIGYNLHQDNEDPSIFIFYETWENADCLEQHMNSAHFKNYVNAVEGLIEGKVVNKMTRVD